MTDQKKLSLLDTLKGKLEAEQKGNLKGTILSVAEMGSKEYYSRGGKPSEFADSPGVAVVVVREGGATFDEFFHYPRENGAVTGTKLGDFIAMYGNVPAPEVKVRVAPVNGLWKIVTALDDDGEPIFRGKS